MVGTVMILLVCIEKIGLYDCSRKRVCRAVGWETESCEDQGDDEGWREGSREQATPPGPFCQSAPEGGQWRCVLALCKVWRSVLGSAGRNWRPTYDHSPPTHLHCGTLVSLPLSRAISLPGFFAESWFCLHIEDIQISASGWTSVDRAPEADA